MYRMASLANSRRVASLKLAGSGTRSPMPTTSCCVVPQVTCGAILVESMARILVEIRPGIGDQATPMRDCSLKHIAPGARIHGQ